MLDKNQKGSMRRASRGGKRMLALAAAMAVAALLVAPESKAALSFNLTDTFSGAPPTSTPPWLTATFAQAGANTVTLTLIAGLEVASEFALAVNFNVNPSIVPSSLAIVETAPVGYGGTAILKGAQNAQNLPGAGAPGSGFDISFLFPVSSPNQFNNGDIGVYTITAAGLLENDFNFTNTGSAAKHVGMFVQGIPNGPAGAVGDAPEPATLALLALGLAGLGVSRRKRAS